MTGLPSARRLLCICLILIAGACAENQASAPAVAFRDSAGIMIVESRIDETTPVCQVAPEPTVTIGMSEGPPEYQLYRTFGAQRLSDGRIAVVNQGSQELRFYSADGQFLFAAGGEGEGPGEFRRAFILYVLPGDTLWVGDYSPWAWEVFAPDGRWLRTVRPQPPSINTDVAAVLDDGRMVIAESELPDTPVNRFAPRQLTPVLHDVDGSVADTIGVFADRIFGRFEEVPNFLISPMFDGHASVTAAGSRVVIGHTSTAELSVHEVEDMMRLDRILRWDAEARPVTDDDVAAERQRISASLEDLDPAMRDRMLGPQIREDRPVAETFPRFSTVELGRDGRIWVRAYRYPSDPDDGHANWLVFGADGAIQCRLTVDRFEQMPAFGADYILVMRRDELGVERIFQHALSAPRPAALSSAE